jgi:aminoglycoside phosphotransferase (APT) family kinase protein
MSGRDRYNEPLRLKERILHFDVAELKRAAAAAVGKDIAGVQSFHKLAEGGFNRVIELTIDGFQVIARLPYPSTYPKHFSVASEVATMDLVRSYGVPVPKVLDYSATRNNAVGAEYIIMEKVNGRDLGDIWYELSEKERIKVVVQVARVESVLFSISLPGCGSVYYKRDLENGTEAVNIAAGKDAGGSAGQLCIGPDVAQKWWYDKRDQLSVSRGPCKHEPYMKRCSNLVLLTL